MSVLAIVVGLILLAAGGELVVRGASRLAVSSGISPVVVGLTVVAFGTSLPELAVTIVSVMSGSPDVAVGNVVGSNIYNILLVLGLGALVAPLIVHQRIVRADVPLLIGVSLLFWALAADGRLEPLDGLPLLAILLAYTAVSVHAGRQERRDVRREYEERLPPVPRPGDRMVFLVTLITAGLIALVAGSQALVAGASDIARSLGVSELVIGLTVVSIGTSMPEIVTTVVAVVRHQRDIAVGNVVGSNLFNLLGVMGIGAVVAPDGIPVAPAALGFDIPIMVVVAIALLPIAFVGSAIRRWEGAVFFGYAAVYTTYVVLDATDQRLADDFAFALGGFVLPLTLITIGTVVTREIMARRAHRAADRRADAALH
jgi:cation:H+ antiporter